MSREDKFLFGVLGVLALVVPVVLGVLADLPVWLIAAATVLALGAVAVRLAKFVRQTSVPAPAYPRPTPKPAEPTSFSMPSISLHSARTDYSFEFTATVYWRPAIRDIRPGMADHGHVAAEAIVARASDIVRHYDPADRGMAELRLAAVLGAMAQDATRQVEAWAQDVRLGVPAADVQRLDRLAELRKARELREHEREAERAHRTYLAQDVLTDAGTALVWWLSRHPDAVEEAVRLRRTFAMLVAAAANRDEDEPEQMPLPRQARRVEVGDRLRVSPDWTAPYRITNGVNGTNGSEAG